MKKTLGRTIAQYVCLFEFIIMIIVVMLQVIFRYVLRISVPWTEELARVLYVSVTFTGVILVESNNINIRTTFIIDRMPLKLTRFILILSNVFSIIIVFFLFIGGVVLIQKTSVYFLASLPFLSKTIYYYPIVIAAPFIIWELINQILYFRHYSPDSNSLSVESEESDK